MQPCGITGTAHQWITNYFRNRIQFVQTGNTKSNALRQICGVPQVSILGPLFFILYLNDLPACPNELELILFADDTSVFFNTAVTWMYLPPFLMTSSSMFQLG